jgi:hypothetical protein
MGHPFVVFGDTIVPAAEVGCHIGSLVELAHDEQTFLLSMC